MPSNYIIDAREIQLQRKENIAKLIERGENTLSQISDNLKPKVNEILEKINKNRWNVVPPISFRVLNFNDYLLGIVSEWR